MGFLLTQIFQQFAFRVWLPATTTPEQELLAYSLPIDKARALAVLAGIVLLLVPFAAIALRYRRVRPVASVLGFTFGTGFVGFELLHRSIDFFVVGRHWAAQLQAATGAQREVILQRFAEWNQFAQGLYFPLMLSYLLASACFAFATASDRHADKWYWLAPVAYSLNALRLLARMASTYAGQHWLDGFNNELYFPAVFTINTLLAIWFFYTARRGGNAETFVRP